MTFTTNTFWGEDVTGQWTVVVRDLLSGDTGTWDTLSVTFHTGELVPIPEPATVLGIAVGVLAVGRSVRRRFSKHIPNGEPATAI